MQSAFVMNDFTFVKMDHPQHSLFMQNMVAFTKDGKNKNDDAPDCICGLSMFMRGMFKK